MKRGPGSNNLGVNSLGAYSRAMREVIAKRIIEIAQRGVKDQQMLVDDAMRFLAANYKDVGKQPA
jgi:hypothetical protein